MRSIHVFDPAARFAVGTIGMPGERTFYLQAVDGARVISVAVEKVQVALLSDRIAELIDDLEVQGDPEQPAALDLPLEEEFRVGVLALSLVSDRPAILIEAQAMGATTLIDADESEGPDLLRVFLLPAQARAFVALARAVVAAGRPDCPFCSLPIDPGGHLCPRANGFRR